MASPYNDPVFMQLGDVMNARVKLRHGALSHIITARILDSYPTTAGLQKLVNDPQLLDQLSDQIAKEVLPSSVPVGGISNPPADCGQVGLTTLPRNNSWSDLLLYSRD
jgi:hypothetical protein